MKDKNITVIIPVRNEEKNIGRCLRAIFKQTILPLEVIIVDGHSSDSTVSNAKKYPVKILYEDYHTRSGACQVAIEEANGEYIAFTDADCIPEKDWLENLVREFSYNIAGVGGAIKNIGDGLWEISINRSMESFLGSANSVQGRIFKNKRFVKSISGCNCIFRREDILTVGGFNVKLTTAEDTDLSNKMLNIGKLIYTPHALVLHNHKRGLKAFARRMYQYGYGRSCSRLWGLQVIPPIIAIFVLLTLIINYMIFLISVSIYCSLLLSMGFIISIREKNIKYLYSMPVVYVVEHVLYTFGFWNGLVG